MKTFIILVAFLGMASAMAPAPTLSSLKDSLKNLNISDFTSVRNLFQQFQQIGDSGSALLQAAAVLFVAKFLNSGSLQGLTPVEITKNFVDNAQRALSAPVNQQWQPGLDMETMGLSAQTFQNMQTLAVPPSSGTNSGQLTSSARRRRQTSDMPESLDWRTKGAVTPVKNQKSCGSCWAFGAVGALEGRYFMKTGKLQVLSEQNLIDCAKNVAGANGTTCCQGCNGGWMPDAYTYVKENKGIASTSAYPYIASSSFCRYISSSIPLFGTKAAATATGYTMIAKDDENDLMDAIQDGPVAVALDASGLQTFKSGIYSCPETKKLNHGLVVVGYGVENGTKYWQVKNSWGDSWGDKGYFKVLRGEGNQCGIASAAVYPTV